MLKLSGFYVFCFWNVYLMFFLCFLFLFITWFLCFSSPCASVCVLVFSCHVSLALFPCLRPPSFFGLSWRSPVSRCLLVSLLCSIVLCLVFIMFTCILFSHCLSFPQVCSPVSWSPLTYRVFFLIRSLLVLSVFKPLCCSRPLFVHLCP